MAQLASHRADTATLSDNVCISHTPYVHTTYAHVNVENVRTICKIDDMDEDTIGERLSEIRKRSGFSMEKVAKGAGYTGRSSVQRYFSSEYDADALPLDIARKLAKGFEGSKVDPQEVMDLVDLAAAPNATVFQMEGAETTRMSRDIPVYGTALGAPETFDGVAIEQTNLDQGDVVTYFRRPVILQGRADVYGLFVQGISMAPRYDEGEAVFAEGKRPPRVGDDAVIYLAISNGDDGESIAAVILKRIVRNSASYLEVEQFNPPKIFKIPKEAIKAVHRVIPFSELLS